MIEVDYHRKLSLLLDPSMLNTAMRSGSSSKNKGPAYWIFIPVVLLSLCVLCMSSQLMQPIAIDLALAAFTIGLLGAGLQWVGFPKAASILAIFVLASYWFPFLLVLFVLMQRSAGGLVLVAYYALLVIPIGLFAVPATLSLAERAGRRWAASAFFLALVPCIMIAGSGEVTQARKNSRGQRAADPMVLKEDFLTIDKCSQQFAVANPQQRFPRSLAQLGPGGTRCLSSDIVGGLRHDFTISYDPAPSGPNGEVDGYQVKASETELKSSERSAMLSNESGLIWFIYQGPKQQTKPYYLYYPGVGFSEVLQCLWESSSRNRKTYDANDPKASTELDQFVNSCVPLSMLTAPGLLTLGDYRYQYKIHPQYDGTTTYEINVRPQEYGVTALRSYLAVGTLTAEDAPKRLNVYATAADRAANEHDPLALVQELNLPQFLTVASEEWCGPQLCK